MARKTRYTVYVEKEIMGKPLELIDAVFAHLIKREMDIAQRKKFLAQFMRAPEGAHQLKVIDEWVIVRDVATFPFRYNNKPDATGENDESTGVEGGVSVDDKPDGEPESGTAPDGSDTQHGPDDEGDAEGSE